MKITNKILYLISASLLCFAQNSSPLEHSSAGEFISEQKISSQRTNYPLLEIHLSEDKGGYYNNLQIQIAAILPKESDRPPILAHIKGSRSSAQNHHCAILGGMGPLSDAHLLNLILLNLREKKIDSFCNIDLLSAPPPRELLEILSKGISYSCNLYTFFHSQTGPIYLASNSAHVNFNLLNRLSYGKCTNLTHYVADKVRAEIASSPHQKVLIVGTKAAKEANLYGQLFRERAIPYVYLEQKEQEIVQQEIERTKMGLIHGNALYEVIEKAIQTSKATVVLLACTELPISLEQSSKNLSDLGVLIIDSEKLFAEKISFDIEQAIYQEFEQSIFE